MDLVALLSKVSVSMEKGSAGRISLPLTCSHLRVCLLPNSTRVDLASRIVADDALLLFHSIPEVSTSSVVVYFV